MAPENLNKETIMAQFATQHEVVLDISDTCHFISKLVFMPAFEEPGNGLVEVDADMATKQGGEKSYTYLITTEDFEKFIDLAISSEKWGKAFNTCIRPYAVV